MSIKLKEGDPILVRDKREHLRLPHGWHTEIFKGIHNGKILTSMKFWPYCIPLRKFNPRNMDETMKYVLRVKDGILVPLN